ncbi:CBF/Mak21 family-domain-containing protein [Kalaharituber pfeilii]|nr:CBF/Mak21 family-domain-containing protein [Kalaharituber pfeilii]
MARKNKSKKAGSTSAAVASQSTPAGNVGPSTTVAGELDLSGDVLKRLQQRISEGMQKANSGGAVGVQEWKQKGKDKAKGEGERKNEEKKATIKPVSKYQTPAKQPSAQSSSSEPRGVKRRREEQNKHSQTKEAAKPSNTSGDVSRNPQLAKGSNKSKKKIAEEDLLKEILELGGTKDDLDLVKDLDADSEEEIIEGTQSKAEKELRADIEKLMRDMGHDVKASSVKQVVNDDEVSEEGEEEEDAKEDEDKYKKEDQQKIDSIKTTNGGVKLQANLPVITKHTKGKLLFPPRSDWHAYELPSLLDGPNPPASTIQSLHSRGKELLTQENNFYSTTHLTKTSDRQFLATIMNSGTLSDKVSALTLISQESPLHTIKTLETLLSLAKKKSRSQAIAALAAIKDLFASGRVLPSGRKLKAFAKQPGLGAKEVTDLHLLVWTFEDWLKNFYFEVLKVLEGLCADQLVFARSHAVGYVWELLKEKPEQEANLLRLLVNKLGDTDRKVASKVSFLLLQLQQTHPAMKAIIINAIESEVLFRPGNSSSAKYYAMITLNQTIISGRDFEIANKLIDVYFAVFTSLLTKPHQHNNANAIKSASQKPIDQNGKLSKKAKKKLEEAERAALANEELNAKLISAVLTGVNRAFPFSKIDDDIFEKHINTLFRITHSGNFNTSIQALMLIHQVSAAKQIVLDRFYRTLYESLLDQRILTSSKQSMYLNLLFKALKADTNIKRIKAFVKRLVQVSTLHQPAFICGVFYLLNELESTFPSLRTMLDTPETGDDEEEVFRDVPDDDEKDSRVALDTLKEDMEKDTKKMTNSYDGRKRDPVFANADRTCLWEVIPFVSHFHPSVSLYASCYLHKKGMPGKPDLSLHTLTHFLDRFVFRNPTTRKTTRGQSIMQPLQGPDSKGVLVSIKSTGKAQQPVNSEQFWKRKIEEVPVDEVFFHKYFNQRGSITKEKSKKSNEKTSKSDDDDGEDDIWKALVQSKPELEVDDDVDMDDAALSDLDDSEDSNDGSFEKSNAEEREDKYGGMSLDSAIAASLQKPKLAAQAFEDSLDDASLGLDSEGSDVWESDDEVEIPSGVDVDMDLEKAFAAELETSAGINAPSSTKKGRKAQKGSEQVKADAADDEDGKKKKKRKLKHLPTFASADDYAHLLSD